MDHEIAKSIPSVEALFDQAVVIWVSGGWAMIGIAFTAVIMFAFGTHVYLKLSGRGFVHTRESTWRYWIDHPESRKGPVGDLLDFVTMGIDLKERVNRFEEYRASEINPFVRDLKVMKICVGTAPLIGLLGTVTGMLATFSALASGLGGDKTMGLVAAGISEALITTETGLVIAIPGLFFQYQLARKLERYKVFLAHVESVVNQHFYKKRDVT